MNCYNEENHVKLPNSGILQVKKCQFSISSSAFDWFEVRAEIHNIKKETKPEKNKTFLVLLEPNLILCFASFYSLHTTWYIWSSISKFLPSSYSYPTFSFPGQQATTTGVWEEGSCLLLCVADLMYCSWQSKMAAVKFSPKLSRIFKKHQLEGWMRYQCNLWKLSWVLRTNLLKFIYRI